MVRMADEASDESVPAPVEQSNGRVRNFRITEPDLADLERILPQLCDMLDLKLNDPKVRAKVRRVREIVADVRWDYGPPSSVEIIPLDDTIG
jgi:hypothetical protein